MYVPRRMRTHYYRSRAEGARSRREIAALFEQYASDASKIWVNEDGRAVSKNAG